MLAVLSLAVQVAAAYYTLDLLIETGASIVDKEALFRPRLPEGGVDVEGLGTFRVRGLNRGEVMFMQRYTDDKARAERYALACAVLDPGPLTEAEVGQWQQASPGGEIEPVLNEVMRLSGLLKDSPKSDVQSDGEQSVD